MFVFFFFFNDTATTEIYTLSLHDALPISFGRNLPSRTENGGCSRHGTFGALRPALAKTNERMFDASVRSEEHTSELQSRQYLVCRLLLEKKKNNAANALPRFT